MYKAVYAEINVLCAFILAIVLFRMRNSNDKQARNIAFSRVVMTSMAILLLDATWMLVDGVPGLHALNLAINAAFLSLTGLAGLLWLAFIEYTLRGNVWRNPRTLIIALIPEILLTCLCVVSVWTGWVFYVDEYNVYHRGPAYLLSVCVSYAYLLFATADVLINVFKPQYKYRRDELFSFLSFAIIPAIGGIFGTIWYGLPTTWTSASLAMLLVFVNFQSYEISSDGLTGLNNRRQFDRYMRMIVDEAKGVGHYALFLMDIDKFKRINDCFGHPIGDHALVRAATVLRGVCRKKDAFLARYGGDEFVIVYHCSGETDAQAFKNSIYAAFSADNAATEDPFSLFMSVGYEIYDSEHPVTTERLVAEADRALYQEKRKRNPQGFAV